MAIVCDNCKIENVEKNGQLCEKCETLIEESQIDKSFRETIYLPDDLFEKFKTLYNQVDESKSDTKKAFAKFIKTLGTSFINKITGKEINDPTPQVIIPKEKTIDRIQKILNHNLAVYASQNDYDTPEDLEDWNLKDMYSDQWEETLYQYVDNINIMETDPVHEPAKPADEPASQEVSPDTKTKETSVKSVTLSDELSRP